jgi:hypothetical protein
MSATSTTTRSRTPSPAGTPKPWEQAAALTYERARHVHNGTGATLPQCRRLCQLLLSTTLKRREWQRLVAVLRAGCERDRASRALEYLTPRVEQRRAERQRKALAPLLTD